MPSNLHDLDQTEDMLRAARDVASFMQAKAKAIGLTTLSDLVVLAGTVHAMSIAYSISEGGADKAAVLDMAKDHLPRQVDSFLARRLDS